jgi:hypothetical protein
MFDRIEAAARLAFMTGALACRAAACVLENFGDTLEAISLFPDAIAMAERAEMEAEGLWCEGDMGATHVLDIADVVIPPPPAVPFTIGECVRCAAPVIGSEICASCDDAMSREVPS